MTITAAELRVVVDADTSKAESGLKSISGKMNNMAGQMGAVGGVLSATIAAPLIGIGVSAIKTAADFERSMNVLGYATEASAAQMQTLSDQALQLGADTVFSANEAAEGMVDLAKAGMTTEEIMGAIPGVMDLAAAGQIGVSDAATLTAAALNTFGLQAEDAAHVADVLAAAANASTAEVSDLAFGLQNAGSVFAANGQSVESLATMMALLANNGINASDAATSLKTMTMRLTAPTAKAAKEMKRLGINVFDAEGNMRDYQDIVSDLEGATLGLSDAQKSAAFNTIFGADAIRAALILSQEGTQGYTDMAAAVNEQGAAAAMANAQNSGLAGAMEQIGGSIESLMTKLALPFLDTLAEWTGTLATFVNQIGTLPQPVINAALAFAGFAAALGAVMLAAAGIAGVIGALATPIGLVALVVLGLAAAVAGLWLAWETNWGNIQGKTEAALAVINPLIEALSANVTAAMTALSNIKMPTLKDLQGLKSEIELQVQTTFKTLLNPPQLTIEPFPPMTIPAPKVTIAPAAGAAGQLAGAATKGAALGGAAGVAQMIDNMTETVKNADWAGAGRLIAASIIAAWNAEMAKLKTLLQWTGIVAGVVEGWVAFNAGLFAALTGFSDGLAALDIPGKITAFATELTAGLSEMFQNIVRSLWRSLTAESPDTGSMSDTLRTNAAAKSNKGPDFSGLTSALSATVVVFEGAGAAVGAFSGIVSAFAWPAVIAAFTWPQTIFDFAWPDALDDFNWSRWIDPLNWGSFIGSLFGGPAPGGSGTTSSNRPTGGGGFGDHPQATPDFMLGGEPASAATAQFGGGGFGNTGVVIRIDNVNVHNDMDIEELAAKLARRFQQKLR